MNDHTRPDGTNFYDEILRIHREYREEVDARIQTGFDYFGRPIDFKKSTVPAFCYRLYSGDSLLYVGKTRDPGGRFFAISGHAGTKEWFKEVTRVELFRFDKESDAFLAEDYDINELSPEFNVRMNPRPKKRPAYTHHFVFDISQKSEIYETVNLETPKTPPNLL